MTFNREGADLGRIAERPGVMSGAPCFAGTRVTVAGVLTWFDAGEPDSVILAAYPSLVLRDLDAARDYVEAAA